MDKKMYLEPEMEAIEVKYNGVLCASATDDNEVPTGDSDEEAGGGW